MFLGIAVVLMGLEASAQTRTILVGPSFSTMLFKVDDQVYTDGYKLNTGFHVAALTEIPLSEKISIETGIFYDSKGFKIIKEDNSADEKFIGKLSLAFLDVPVTAKFRSELKGEMAVFAKLGPFIGGAVSGKQITIEKGNGDTYRDIEKVDFGNNEDTDFLRRLDYGLIIGGGLEINTIVLGVLFDLGLANVAVETGDTLKTRTLKVSIGYKIVGK